MYSVNGTSTAEKNVLLGATRPQGKCGRTERGKTCCSMLRHHRVTFIITFSVGVQGPKTLQQGRPPHLARAALLQSFVTGLFL